jgi:hypothetical protein
MYRPKHTPCSLLRLWCNDEKLFPNIKFVIADAPFSLSGANRKNKKALFIGGFFLSEISGLDDIIIAV